MPAHSTIRSAGCEHPPTNSHSPCCRMPHQQTQAIPDITMKTYSATYMVAGHYNSITCYKKTQLHLTSHMRTPQPLITQKYQKKSLYNYPSTSQTTIKIPSSTKQLWRPSPAPLPHITNTHTLALRITQHDRHDQHTIQCTSQPLLPQLHLNQIHPHSLRCQYDKRIARFSQTLHHSESHR